MDKINIGGYEFNDFGVNNFSNGMHLISSTDRPKEILEMVKSRKLLFEDIWLNPSSLCSNSEFYGFFGTKEQYKEVYRRQKEAQISKLLVERFGSWDAISELSVKDFREAKEEIESNYKDWWEE